METGTGKRRSRRRRKKKNGVAAALLILLVCICLASASWMAVRFFQSAQDNRQEVTAETSRPVEPQTIPEKGAETFIE